MTCENCPYCVPDAIGVPICMFDDWGKGFGPAPCEEEDISEN